MEKYRATIHGNKVEWEGEAPKGVRTEGGLTVDVTVIGKPKSAKKPSGKRAVAALQKIADRGGIRSIPDPVRWQREIRRDRRLPGR